MGKCFLSNILTVVFLLSTSFIVNAENNTDWRVIISGKVINMTDKSARVITAINCNPWSDKISRHAVEIDSSGQFNTYVEIPYGHNFTINYDRKFLCQYAEPGDSLSLIIDASNLKSGAFYSGAHEKLNNEYGKIYADIFHKSFVELPSEEMSKEVYLDKFKLICSGLDDILNNYADSVGMSEEPKDLMRRSFLFTVANSALDHKDKTPERVLEFFEDSIFGLNDENNLREMMFNHHLHAYLNRLERVVCPDSISQMVDAIVNRHPKSLNIKIVYLDLWATWCGPCIESNKSLPEVADFFKDKDKDMVFVSVAMSSDLNQWRKLVGSHPENCRAFFINSGADAELIMSKFGMNGFPTYRIIDTDSQIINSDPPRPNNPAIYEYLLKLL